MAHKDLAFAVSLFRELGWENAKPNVLDSLPVGDEDQQQRARRGLSSGRWIIESSTYPYEDTTHIGHVNPFLLTLFALRLTVAPSRVVSLLRTYGTNFKYHVGGRSHHREIAALIRTYDLDYQLKFIEEAAKEIDIRGSWLDHPDEFNVVSFFLVAENYPTIAIPRHENYLLTWSFLAAHAMIPESHALEGDTHLTPTLDDILPTVGEHLHACFEQGLPLWDQLGHVAVCAYHRGLVERDAVVTAAFSALGAAVRPGQRLRMAELLMKELKVTDAEIAANIPLISGVLAAAEPRLISALGLHVLAVAPAEALADCALPMLYVTTLKGQRDLLTALKKRTDVGPAVHALLTPRIQELALSTDQKVAVLASKLLEAWGLGVEAATISDAAFYPWNPTPDVWELPRFERIDPTCDAIVELLHNFPITSVITAIEVEQCFLAFTELAATDPEAAQRLSESLKRDVPWWMSIPDSPTPLANKEFLATQHPVSVRNFQIQHSLGELPCVLSEPSFVDFSILFDDLIDRLHAYARAGAQVRDADLTLALSRLDRSGLDVASAQVEARALNVPVLPRDDTAPPRYAGEIVADFLANPYEEPALEVRLTQWKWEHRNLYRPAPMLSPASVSDVPDFLVASCNDGGLSSAVAPRWGDVVWTDLCFDRSATAGFEGALAHQAARSHAPLGPGAAMNLIAMLQPTTKGGLELAHGAVRDAWGRGLLRPGVADPAFLCWDPASSAYGRLAEVCLDLADQGMLSVAWPLLDAILVHTVSASFATTRVAAVVQAMCDLAPSVAHAIEVGTAPREAANVPGLRHYAALTKKTKAVTVAKQAVRLLPAKTRAVSAEASEVFAQVDLGAWFKPAAEVVCDDAECSLMFINQDVDDFRVVVEFPHHNSIPLISHTPCYIKTFDLGAFLDFQELTLFTDDGFPTGYYVYARWLNDHWEVQEKSTAGFPEEAHRLTTTVVFALLAALTSKKTSSSALKFFLDKGMISADAVNKAMHTLAGVELFTPIHILGMLKTPIYLHYLWPVLTECLGAGARTLETGGTAPQWLGKVLDTCVAHSAILGAATAAGHIPTEAWKSLSFIAAQKKKTAAVKKAQTLSEQFVEKDNTHGS